MLGSALACVLLAVSPPAAAQMQTFWGDGTGDWFNAANWSAGVPNSSITAKINNGGTAQIGAAGAAASDLDLGVDTAHTGTVAIDGSGELSIGAILDVGVNGLAHSTSPMAVQSLPQITAGSLKGLARMAR